MDDYITLSFSFSSPQLCANRCPLRTVCMSCWSLINKRKHHSLRNLVYLFALFAKNVASVFWPLSGTGLIACQDANNGGSNSNYMSSFLLHPSSDKEFEQQNERTKAKLRSTRSVPSFSIEMICNTLLRSWLRGPTSPYRFHHCSSIYMSPLMRF